MSGGKSIQHIGLLLTANEEDIIEEVMDNHVRFFDKILALDGSHDKTPEIIQSYDAVKYFTTDREISPSRPIRDGARGHLLEKAQEMFGTDGWITLLHGDEIWYHDPLAIAELADSHDADVVWWHAVHFFLHTSERDGFDAREDPEKPITERRLFYNPGWREVRQFRNRSGLYFPPPLQGQVYPVGIDPNNALGTLPIYRHYSWRTPDQIMERAKQRLETGFVTYGHHFIDKGDAFMKTLPDYSIVKKFDGDFGEYEDPRLSTFVIRNNRRPNLA